MVFVMIGRMAAVFCGGAGEGSVGGDRCSLIEAFLCYEIGELDSVIQQCFVCPFGFWERGHSAYCSL